jgi:hypothetical protein
VGINEKAQKQESAEEAIYLVRLIADFLVSLALAWP